MHKIERLKFVQNIFLCKSLQNNCKKLQTGPNLLTSFESRGIKKP